MEIKIEKSNVLKAYNEADELGKQLLTNLFGSEVVSQKITDRVKSYEDACEILGLSTACPSGSPDEIAYKKIKVIARALNEGWKPDWSNSNEYKYYPYFKISWSGVSFFVFLYYYSCIDVGSRLCYKSAELAEYAGKQFTDIYSDYLLIK